MSKQQIKSAAILLLASAGALTQIGCAKEMTLVNDYTALKPVKWKCEEVKGQTRKNIIESNSVLASLKSGRPTVYSDDCPTEKQAPTS